MIGLGDGTEESHDRMQAALDRLLATVRRIQVTAQQPPVRLGHSVVPGGELFLLRVPLEQDGFDPAMIYVALAPSEETERELVQKGRAPHKSSLVQNCLVQAAHEAKKAFHLVRHYAPNELAAVVPSPVDDEPWPTND